MIKAGKFLCEAASREHLNLESPRNLQNFKFCTAKYVSKFDMNELNT